MIRMHVNDFSSIYGSKEYGGLYEKLLPTAKGEPNNIIAFDETSLGEAFRLMLQTWLRSGSVKFTQSFELTDALAKQQQAAREAAEANDRAIEQAAWDRLLKYYVKEQGLLWDNEHNEDLIIKWFVANKARFTAYNVNLAINSLASELHWAVWSPRLQPVEEVRTLPNGEPELPLNASESQMRRASRAQLEDLSKRKGEFTAHRRGSFGSKFFEETIKRDRPLV